MVGSTRIQLSTPNWQLCLSPNERGWTQVELHGDGITHALGAERLGHILAKLDSFLTDTTPHQRWVVSFSEAHATIYGEHSAEQAILRIQDAEGSAIAVMELSDENRQDWIAEIRRHAGRR